MVSAGPPESAGLDEARRLRAQGRHGEAITLLERAVEADPASAEAWATLGSSYFHMNRYDSARQAMERTVAMAPQFVEGWLLLGNCRVFQGDIVSAMEAYDTAHRLSPDLDAVASGRLFYMAFHPEGYRHLPDACKAWGAALERSVVRLPSVPRQPSARLRIGYLSEEFGVGATTNFFEPVLTRHDPERFEVFVYGATPDLAAKAEHARDLAGLDARAIAECIRADAIDILVLVTSYRAIQRRPLAYKPAPIQVCYCNLASTTGLASVDYLVTDVMNDPPGSEREYTEKLVRLSARNLYAPADNAPPVSARPPGAPVTFSCFNNIGKITPIGAETWARILTAIPDARLAIKTVVPMAEDADWTPLRNVLARAGVPLERVALLKTLPSRTHHLAAFAAADIALDPIPFNGGASSCDALWMGVPVVTRRGETFFARQTSAFLSKLGLEDLIARDERDYVEIALRLARDEDRRADLRRAMRDLMRTRLLDYDRHVRELEDAYRVMWDRHAAGQPPAAFSLAD